MEVKLNTGNEYRYKEIGEHGSFDNRISLEHKVTSVMASLSADVRSQAMLEADEPSLEDIHQTLNEIQGKIKQLLKTSFQLSADVADIKNSVERNRQELTNLKQELVKQNNCIASLKKQLTKTSKSIKEHAGKLQDIQVNFNDCRRLFWSSTVFPKQVV